MHFPSYLEVTDLKLPDGSHQLVCYTSEMRDAVAAFYSDLAASSAVGRLFQHGEGRQQSWGHWRVLWCFPAQQQGQALALVCWETAGARGLTKGSTVELPGRGFAHSL